MTGMCRIPIRRARILWQLAVMLTFAINAADAQERQYAIGSTVDLVSGSDSNPVNSITGGLPQGSTGPASFFRLYPGISLVRSGGSSTLKASYTLELAGTRGDADYNSLSHGASLTFSYPASSRWRLNLTESFLATSDAASFNGLRGTTPPLAEFRFLFDPVALRLSTRNNTAGINTEYSLNPRSSLSLNASHALRQYGDSAIRTLSLLDQQFITGTINYTQKTSARDAWSVGYTASYFSFQNFGNTASHTAHVGYSLGISPDVKLELTVGATRVGVLG